MSFGLCSADGLIPSFIRQVRRQFNEMGRQMAAIRQVREDGAWCCIKCRGRLTADAHSLRCAGCAGQYPVIADIPILVRDPGRYLRSELALLTHTLQHSRERRDLLDRIGRDLGLPDASLDRHRDVIGAEIAVIEMFLGMLESAAQTVGDAEADPLSLRRSGWTVEALLPYLLRDWTSTSELEAIGSRIGGALKQSFPDPSGKSVVFAACGAGGLLSEISLGFEHIWGFDLTLSVLIAARRLLDGASLDLAQPRTINPAARITLRRRDGGSTNPKIKLAAMDAFDTAFADGSVDCVVTSFLIDLIAEPLRLTGEIRRILARDGIWINYGPSGPLKALWRFDQAESAAFLDVAGFTVIGAEAFRSTYLDLSRDCPSWGFQSHICYLTLARKEDCIIKEPIVKRPSEAELPEIIPQHFPGAGLIQRQSLDATRTCTTLFRHESISGRVRSSEISAETARIMTLVDGKRTVSEIAKLLNREAPPLPVDEVISAIAYYLEQGLLSWRGR